MQLQIDKLGKVAITIEQDYWDINKDYNKLVIVEVKDKFATYISRKPVPAGTVLTDRRYWIPFSSLKESIVIDYNSFKADYDERLETAKTDIDNLEEDVRDLQKLKCLINQLIEINRLLREDVEKTNEAAQAVIKKANCIIAKIEKYIQSIGFSEIGYGLTIIDEILQVKPITDEELDNILI